MMLGKIQHKEDIQEHINEAFDTLRTLLHRLEEHKCICEVEAKSDAAASVDLSTDTSMEDVGKENDIEDANGPSMDMGHFCVHMRATYGCTEPYVGLTFNSSKIAASFVCDFCLLNKKKECVLMGQGHIYFTDVHTTSHPLRQEIVHFESVYQSNEHQKKL